MSHAIDKLMREHRFIEKVLGSLEAFVNQLEVGQKDARQRVADYAEFFREFADRCHHGKEEDRLFRVLGDHGFPRDAGPIFVMIGEHNMGRACVKGLAAIGAGRGPLTEVEVQQVNTSARTFTSMLRMHIQKEDEILFPAAERALPPAVLEQLAGDFDAFEESAMGQGEHLRLQALGARLLADGPGASAA